MSGFKKSHQTQSASVHPQKNQYNSLHTLGGGDNFVAGFITGVVDGLSLEEALYFGSATAAIAISQYGANGAVKSKQQVLEYLVAHRK